MTSNDANTKKKKVIEFIIDYIIDNTAQDNVEVCDNSNFIKEHLLDSFATLSMIMTLESEFGIKFEPSELADEGMRVIHELAEIIVNK